jgi:hypothetical protein
MQTAWFGEKHLAESVACPRCEAHVGKPCVSTGAMPGTCVGAGVTISGLHLERIEVVRLRTAESASS